MSVARYHDYRVADMSDDLSAGRVADAGARHSLNREIEIKLAPHLGGIAHACSAMSPLTPACVRWHIVGDI